MHPYHHQPVATRLEPSRERESPTNYFTPVSSSQDMTDVRGDGSPDPVPSNTTDTQTDNMTETSTQNPQQGTVPTDPNATNGPAVGSAPPGARYCIFITVTPTLEKVKIPRGLWTSEEIAKEVRKYTGSLQRVIPIGPNCAYLIFGDWPTVGGLTGEQLAPMLRLVSGIGVWAGVPVQVAAQGMEHLTGLSQQPWPVVRSDAIWKPIHGLAASLAESSLGETEDDEDEDGLVGNTPPRRSPLLPTPPPSQTVVHPVTIQENQRTTRKTRRTAGRSRRSPRPPPPSDSEYQDYEDYVHDLVLPGKKNGKSGGTIQLGEFDETRGRMAYINWKKDVESYRLSHGDAAVTPAVYRALRGGIRDFAHVMRQHANLQQLLNRLDEYFTAKESYEDLMDDVHKIVQQKGECFNTYAFRIARGMESIRVAFPERTEESDQGEVRALFRGMREGLKKALGHLEQYIADRPYYPNGACISREEFVRLCNRKERELDSKFSRWNAHSTPTTLAGKIARATDEEYGAQDREEASKSPEPDTSDQDNYLEFCARVAKAQFDQFQKREKRCFHCGDSGHFIRDCPKRGEAKLSLNTQAGAPAKGTQPPQ